MENIYEPTTFIIGGGYSGIIISIFTNLDGENAVQVGCFP